MAMDDDSEDEAIIQLGLGGGSIEFSSAEEIDDFIQRLLEARGRAFYDAPSYLLLDDSNEDMLALLSFIMLAIDNFNKKAYPARASLTMNNVH